MTLFPQPYVNIFRTRVKKLNDKKEGGSMQDFLKLFCCLYLCLVLFADNRFVYCEEKTLNTF